MGNLKFFLREVEYIKNISYDALKWQEIEAFLAIHLHKAVWELFKSQV